MGALSIWHWLILLVVVALVFGTSKLKKELLKFRQNTITA